MQPIKSASGKAIAKLVALALAIPLLAGSVGAIVLTLYMWTLSGAALVVPKVGAWFGYNIQLTEEIQKASLPIGGAITVALVALLGIYWQNRAADLRHKRDKELELKKDIFMEVAEAYAKGMHYLTSYLDHERTPRATKKPRPNLSRATYKAHVVASIETIESMMELNRVWVEAYSELQRLPPPKEGAKPEEIFPLIDALQRNTSKIMGKLLEFNVRARVELGTEFPDKKRYIDAMDNQISKMKDFIEDIKRRAEANNQSQAKPN